jgi:hypothetical protein
MICDGFWMMQIMSLRETFMTKEIIGLDTFQILLASLKYCIDTGDDGQVRDKEEISKFPWVRFLRNHPFLIAVVGTLQMRSHSENMTMFDKSENLPFCH